MKGQDLLKYILLSLKSEVINYKTGFKKIGKTKAVSILAVATLAVNQLLTANGYDGGAASEYLSDKVEGILYILVFLGVLKDDEKQ